ncbi:MAG: amidase [Chloroflexota bacterium]|nr:amidase [Chloroflexota bacterium]
MSKEDVEEFTIAGLQASLSSGEHSIRSITEMYLDRIEEIDRNGPALNAVIELNPDAVTIADSLDAERGQRGPRGPLHGVPILLKDNIDTADRMMTTAGSLALVGSIARQDAFVVQRLREAGAVILGKTNLSEWANFRSTHSTSGWSSRGGLTRNPYALDRSPSGSSSGSAAAVAANLCAAAVGTETDGSITAPSSVNGIVGIKPTVGLVSRTGIIPISHSQDTAGPMARTVADAASLLSAMTGRDPRDAAMSKSRGKAPASYQTALNAEGLRGIRIGVGRDFFGGDARVDKVIESAIDALKHLGAEIIDPISTPTAARLGGTEREVLLFEFKADLNRYLRGLGPGAEVHSLKDLIGFNERIRERVMPYFGQELLKMAQDKGSLTSEKYLSALHTGRSLSREQGIDAALREHGLDAIVAPSAGPAGLTDLVNWDARSAVRSASSLAAVAGYPHITVPAGHVFGLPVGVSFLGGAFSEATLIKIAFAFEQETQARRPPRFLPTADLMVGTP